MRGMFILIPSCRPAAFDPGSEYRGPCVYSFLDYAINYFCIH